MANDAIRIEGDFRTHPDFRQQDSYGRNIYGNHFCIFLRDPEDPSYVLPFRVDHRDGEAPQLRRMKAVHSVTGKNAGLNKDSVDDLIGMMQSGFKTRFRRPDYQTAILYLEEKGNFHYNGTPSCHPTYFGDSYAAIAERMPWPFNIMPKPLPVATNPSVHLDDTPRKDLEFLIKIDPLAERKDAESRTRGYETLAGIYKVKVVVRHGSEILFSS
jgi:hypothetical protein